MKKLDDARHCPCAWANVESGDEEEALLLQQLHDDVLMGFRLFSPSSVERAIKAWERLDCDVYEGLPEFIEQHEWPYKDVLVVFAEFVAEGMRRANQACQSMENNGNGLALSYPEPRRALAAIG